jgi:hypothetical protein
MPWAISLPQKQLIVTLARGKCVGFNDSHLTEKLRDEEDLSASRETVRRILRTAKRLLRRSAGHASTAPADRRARVSA